MAVPVLHAQYYNSPLSKPQKTSHRHHEPRPSPSRRQGSKPSVSICLGPSHSLLRNRHLHMPPASLTIPQDDAYHRSDAKLIRRHETKRPDALLSTTSFVSFRGHHFRGRPGLDSDLLQLAMSLDPIHHPHDSRLLFTLHSQQIIVRRRGDTDHEP